MQQQLQIATTTVDSVGFTLSAANEPFTVRNQEPSAAIAALEEELLPTLLPQIVKALLNEALTELKLEIISRAASHD